MLVSQSFGVVSGAVLVGLTGEAQPPTMALAWGAAAGLAGICGLAFFYRALSVGAMALVAPLAGVISAALPATVGIVQGESFTALRALGLVVALAAIVLISLPRRDVGTTTERHMTRGDFTLAVVAGLGFAFFFLFLHWSTSEGGEAWWPLLMVRLAGLAAILVAVLVAGAVRGSVGRVLGVPQFRASVAVRGTLAVAPLFLLAGLGDMFGNLLFLLGDHADDLAVVVVLSSLYPVMTAILAAIFLHERLGRLQLLGVGAAALAAGLIGVG